MLGGFQEVQCRLRRNNECSACASTFLCAVATGAEAPTRRERLIIENLAVIGPVDRQPAALLSVRPKSCNARPCRVRKSILPPAFNWRPALTRPPQTKPSWLILRLALSPSVVGIRSNEVTPLCFSFRSSRFVRGCALGTILAHQHSSSKPADSGCKSNQS